MPYLRKLHYNVMCRVMEMNEADILVRMAKSVAGKHYALYEIDKMVVLDSLCRDLYRATFQIE